MQGITEGVLQQISGDIEKLLLEQYEGIGFAYLKIADGIKLSISVDLAPSSKGISTEYNLSYPLEPKPDPAQKQKTTLKRIINEAQQDMFENTGETPC